MSEWRARVAAHLGVEPDEFMHVVERGDQIVVIYSDYRKVVIPASKIAPLQPPPNTTPVRDGGRSTPKGRK